MSVRVNWDQDGIFHVFSQITTPIADLHDHIFSLGTGVFQILTASLAHGAVDVAPGRLYATMISTEANYVHQRLMTGYVAFYDDLILEGERIIHGPCTMHAQVHVTDFSRPSYFYLTYRRLS